MSEVKHCALCKRQVGALTRHHLIPRTRHSNKRNKRDFDRADVKTRIVLLCRPCHNHIHALFTEKKLEREFNTLKSLAAHPDVARFVNWIRTKPDGFRPSNQMSSARR
jgi:5-methylcytosine-specific restriction endonuclease McrA